MVFYESRYKAYKDKSSEHTVRKVDGGWMLMTWGRVRSLEKSEVKMEGIKMKPIYEIPRTPLNMANIAQLIGSGCTRQPMRSSATNALREMIGIGAVIPADNRIVG